MFKRKWSQVLLSNPRALMHLEFGSSFSEQSRGGLLLQPETGEFIKEMGLFWRWEDRERGAGTCSASGEGPVPCHSTVERGGANRHGQKRQHGRGGRIYSSLLSRQLTQPTRARTCSKRIVTQSFESSIHPPDRALMT